MYGLLATGLMLGIAFFVGRASERRHFSELARRELQLQHAPVTTLRRPPAAVEVARSQLVTGSAVISLDYFKRFAAGLRSLIGGRIRAYEPLLVRGRREALLRMREQAALQGFDMVINVRLETSCLAATGSDGKRTAGVEVLAYGTALQTAPTSAPTALSR